VRTFLATIALLVADQPASADPAPAADELLKRYDAIMGPENFQAVAEMTAHRDDGTRRTYRMRILKGRDRMRIWFTQPPAAQGHEVLRQGANVWIYVPNLKRATRVVSRESFRGGDFNNVDILRPNYQVDYHAQLQAVSSVPGAWELELRARTDDVFYPRIKLWLSRSDGMPIKGEYYDAEDTLLRAADFLEVRSFGGFRRPSRIVMKNMMNTNRSSELVVSSFNHRVNPSPSTFLLANFGR
jgi:outer membrane lipoprotein-sorting protein